MNDLRTMLMASAIYFLVPASALAAPDVAMIPNAYAAPATLITLAGGRAINLRCTGKGDRVVLLEAGANADSSTFFRVMPLLKGRARVCAYDRAGYGFSDEGPMPRDLAADVADLHALIRAANLSLPLVLVGHSLGSNIVRRYAQQYPADVVGMVLIDPPEQGADAAMPAEWKREDQAMRVRRDAFLDLCEQSAASAEVAAGCLRAPPPWMGAQVAAAVEANKLLPKYWRTLRSELAANQVLFAAPVSANERYGNIPLILMSANASYEGVADDVRARLEQARTQTHLRILAGSTRSRRVNVTASSHDIQLDQPRVVAAAVKELLETAKAH